MRETSARLLRLLSLLQARREWSGTELADRLGVSARTVRRDVERLRELGYPVNATRGSTGYQLGAGASLPPLLLDDDEAVAVVLGLRTATAGTVAGIEETSLRALTKLEQVLPSRLRHRVATLQQATLRVTHTDPTIGEVAADALMVIAEACRANQRLRFDYTTHNGRTTVRSAEPHRLINWDRRWYLVGWDTDRDDWRIFRVDRLTPRTPTGPRFTPREPPEGDVTAYLAHQLSTRTWPYQATVTLHESAESVSDRVWPGTGVIESLDAESCLLHVGADSLRALVWMITSVDADFTLTSGPPGLAEAFHAQATRCQRAASSGA